MKKFLAMLLAVLMLVSLMTACGSKAEEPVVENNEGGEAAPEKKERILNFCGQLGDFQFGDMAQSITLQLAEEYNMEQVCVEYGTDTSTCVTMLMDAADQGYDYIVTSSWNVCDAILADSGLYPDTDFLVFDSGPDYVWDNRTFTAYPSVRTRLPSSPLCMRLP
jgi:basic membrane lipoprotein Med (substrate-binding protein (PBP1-ABC) superfamily)